MATEQTMPEALWIVIGACFILLVAAGAYYVMVSTFDRVRTARRLKLALGDKHGPKSESRLVDRGANVRSAVGRAIVVLGRLMPLGDSDRQKIVTSLQRGGYRSSNAVAAMLGVKFACLVVGMAASLIVSIAFLPGLMGLFVGLVSGVLVGVILNVVPELVLGRVSTHRLRRIESGLAEAFDLLVVCLESGLTFNRALSRTADNLKAFQPQLAREFGQAVLDMNVHGRTREDALGRLADRLDSQGFRDLAVTVAQSERHGTPLADALRKLASSIRVETVSRVQEKMARLPTLLIIPSIACLLPGIMVIVGGPALIQLTKSLGSIGGG